MKLPELKKKFRNRYAIKIVACVLTVALLGSSMTAVAVQADQKEGATVETTAETSSDNKVDASDIEDLVSIKANDKEIGKDESVYLISDASGKVYNTIVSDHLTNKDKADTLEDQ